MPATRKANASEGMIGRPKVTFATQPGKGADRRVRGEREIREAQHREDRGQADGRHRQDGAGHDAVDDQLQDSGRRRRAMAHTTFRNLGLPFVTLCSGTGSHDVADVGEVARAAGALVVDLLALGERLQPVDGAVDLQAADPG